MKQSPPLRPDAPLPSSVSWPHALKPPTIQGCVLYSQVVRQAHQEADARSTVATREFLRLRAVTEAEAAKALVPATVTPATATVAKEQERKPGWFRRLFR